jgi:hypothetical protein
VAHQFSSACGRANEAYRGCPERFIVINAQYTKIPKPAFGRPLNGVPENRVSGITERSSP